MACRAVAKLLVCASLIIVLGCGETGSGYPYSIISLVLKEKEKEKEKDVNEPLIAVNFKSSRPTEISIHASLLPREIQCFSDFVNFDLFICQWQNTLWKTKP